jgi:2'-5' RNA ligase
MPDDAAATPAAPGAAGVAPLILTLAFDAGTFSLLDGLRRQHFPAKRNVIPAHLTLFHLLPGERAEEIAATLREVVGRTPAFALSLPGVRFLGKGVAIDVSAPPLPPLRAALAERWVDWLGRQDAQPHRPHCTIQNKVDPPTARALYERLRREWDPVAGRGEGLLLWRYLGGPWESVGTFPFVGGRVGTAFAGAGTG